MPVRTAPREGLADSTRRQTAAWPELSQWGFVVVAPGVWILPSACLPCLSLERLLFA
jgi:hypothetical protein